MIRNIIFDWSGTLVDDLPAVLAATNFVFAQCGVAAMSLEQFRAEFCLPFKLSTTASPPGCRWPNWNGPFQRPFQPTAGPGHRLAARARVFDFLPGAAAADLCLEHGASGVFRAASGGDRFAGYIERSLSGRVGQAGQDRGIAGRKSIAPAETLFIGDMQHDIETAKHGGVHSCAVLTGYNRLAQLRASEPDRIVEHLGQLRDLLAASGWTGPTAMEHPRRRRPIRSARWAR